SLCFLCAFPCSPMHHPPKSASHSCPQNQQHVILERNLQMVFSGLKIPGPERDVPVRFRSRAPGARLDLQAPLSRCHSDSYVLNSNRCSHLRACKRFLPSSPTGGVDARLQTQLSATPRKDHRFVCEHIWWAHSHGGGRNSHRGAGFAHFWCTA